MKTARVVKALLSCLRILGMLSLSFLLGAAVMFFELPSSSFLYKAFVGACAAHERKQALARFEGGARSAQALPFTPGKIDELRRTFDGFTLITFVPEAAAGKAPRENTQAFLVNMRGDVVHRWEAPFQKVWPNPSHVRPLREDATLCFFGCHLYPNGDLLVVYQGFGTPTYGYGLAKLDKDSHVLWKYSANVHHDVDVGEDGTIYALGQEVLRAAPAGLDFIPVPYLVDYLILLSPAGVELKRIAVLEAFRDSPYSLLLSSIQKPSVPAVRAGATFEDAKSRDVLHLNAVKVLSRALAPKFPMFKAGHVLTSICHLNVIAVVDPQDQSVVWAARGPWKAQHDAQFLDNGHLLFFDNLGSSAGSRVLEYDPETQSFPWAFSGENGNPFLSKLRGMCQRLPNGNTLAVNAGMSSNSAQARSCYGPVPVTAPFAMRAGTARNMCVF